MIAELKRLVASCISEWRFLLRSFSATLGVGLVIVGFAKTGHASDFADFIPSMLAVLSAAQAVYIAREPRDTPLDWEPFGMLCSLGPQAFGAHAGVLALLLVAAGFWVGMLVAALTVNRRRLAWCAVLCAAFVVAANIVQYRQGAPPLASSGERAPMHGPAASA